jgi:hypothetical protein
MAGKPFFFAHPWYVERPDGLRNWISFSVGVAVINLPAASIILLRHVLTLQPEIKGDDMRLHIITAAVDYSA